MKKVVAEFEGRLNAEVRRQEKLDLAKKKKTLEEKSYWRSI